MSDILVVGSMNMDLVVQTGRCPDKGETIIGNNFSQIPGGKGANQALAVGKLGGNVRFIGACGTDAFGDKLLDSLEAGGVKIDDVFRVEESTGIASIIIEADGDNRIIVVQGANKKLTSTKINSLEAKIKEAKVVLLQLEIPLETVVKTVELASKYKTKVILDPAPAQKLPSELYDKIDFLLPNQGELDLLLEDFEFDTEQEKVDQLLNWGVNTVLLTKGKAGVSVYTTAGKEDYPGIKVEVIDTTAAGDAFAGAFAYALQQGWSQDKMIEFANTVAALSVTKLGAQSSLPSNSEVEEFQLERR